MGGISNVGGLGGALLLMRYWRLSGNRVFILLLALFCGQIAYSLWVIHNATFVFWTIASIYSVYIWWTKRPPRKRRFRAKVKALFRKIKAHAPRPLAPVPVGAR